MSYPYVNSPEKLIEFMKKLATIGQPPSFGVQNLKQLGFTSSNDERFLYVIKFLGLVEDKKGGAPTALWSELRSNFPVAMAKAIRAGYADLFTVYPNANSLDQEALRNFFAANTKVGSDAVARMVSTFKTLCSMAKFNEEESAPLAATAGAARTGSEKIEKPVVRVAHGAADGMTININIQLQVPPDATGEIYDKFFSSMKKHLWADEQVG